MIEKDLLAKIRRADYDFNLINNGDIIAVGISGGKDSLTLLRLLKEYQKFPYKKFSFFGIYLDLGFKSEVGKAMQQFSKDIGVEIFIEDNQDVYKILTQHEKNGLLPCSICSRMKKAAMNKASKKHGANKVAFAHHEDDAIETLFLNEIYGGRVATFAPKMFLTNEQITFIRPLIYAKENEIKEYSAYYKLPVTKSKCPNDHVTKREEIKQLLNSIYLTFPESKANFSKMVVNEPCFDLWFDKFYYSFGDHVSIKRVITKEDMFDVINIRMQVFCLEQGIRADEEIDNIDKTCDHYLIFKDNVVVGTIRYYFENGICHIGRFAILQQYRNQGLGTKLIKFIEKLLSKDHFPLNISLLGQAYLKQYYEKLGYETNGNIVVDAGIDHYLFTKIIEKPIVK